MEESEQSPSNPKYTNCTKGDQLYWNALKFNDSEGDSGSYWCHVIIQTSHRLESSHIHIGPIILTNLSAQLLTLMPITSHFFHTPSLTGMP